MLSHVAILYIYADDGQLYASETNPRRLEERMVREVEIANSWFQRNEMIANPSKHQGMILTKTDHQFSFRRLILSNSGQRTQIQKAHFRSSQKNK